VRLEGKVAIVTGGGTGIGAAVARRFAQEGARVGVMGRRRDVLDQVAGEIGGVAIDGDAGVTVDVRRAIDSVVEGYGGLDIALASAGGHGTGSVLDTDDASWAESVHSNLTTAFVLVREALPHVIERHGSIVLISSLAGHFAGPEVAGYTATKHGLIGLARSVARDYGRQGVRANVVSPGWVRTPMADEEMDSLAERLGLSREEAYATVTSEVPLRRPATPDEIASICLFLASDESAVMNGAVLMADGGAHIVDLPTLAFDREQGD
jgi:meso-butanediol dehydrogenase / (S,S)-butanediol dehydrogenase / diacetyl reductase